MSEATCDEYYFVNSAVLGEVLFSVHQEGYSQGHDSLLDSANDDMFRAAIQEALDYVWAEHERAHLRANVLRCADLAPFIRLLTLVLER